jgi:hypothetical protein
VSERAADLAGADQSNFATSHWEGNFRLEG